MPVNIITGNKGSVEVVMGDKNTAKEGASIQTGEGHQQFCKSKCDFSHHLCLTCSPSPVFCIEPASA